MRACEEFGADLFALARSGDAPDDELGGHLGGCATCSASLEELRGMVNDLEGATPDLIPRPETRRTVMREVRTDGTSLAPPPRRGRIHRLGLPVAIAAASLAAGILVVASLNGTPVPEGIIIQPRFNVEAIDGIVPGSAWRPGSVLSAKKIASMDLGAPLHAHVVLDKGTRLQIPGNGEAGATLELLAGPCFVDRSAADSKVPLVVRAGAATVHTRDGSFTVERRGSGAVSVYVASGSVIVRSGERSTTLSGPSRVEVDPTRGELTPAPAEPGDATGWFAYPEVTATLETGADGSEDLIVTLRPSIPEDLSIAPWDRFDPVLSLRVFREETGLQEIEIAARHLARPAPKDDGDGTFLLKKDRPYTMRIRVDTLGLESGDWRAEVLYSASRPGGPWRGSRASNSLTLQIP